MDIRNALLEYIASKIAALSNRAVVAIDGADGSGKTTFANELAPIIEQKGRPVIRASIDGFHNPRRIRYRRGKDGPEGFFLEFYDYASARMHLIEPFKQGAESVEVACFDHRTDQKVTSARLDVPDGSVLVIDGIFLHRDELCSLWDQSAFLDVPFDVSYARMAVRDGSSPNPAAAENRRYLEGQKLYLKSSNPRNRATYVIDYAKIDAPKLVTGCSIP